MIHKKNSNYTTNLIFLILVLIICYCVIFLSPINPLCYDVFGYYMYLPLKFKYNDITIQNYDTIQTILNTYHNSETFYQALKWEGTNNWVMRYPMGVSVLLSPFYFIADYTVRFTNYPADGFSKHYQNWMLYGGLFYTILGLYYTKKILTEFFSDAISAITLLLIVLSTNYFFHTTLHGQGIMSHNFIYTLYAVIFYYTIKWHQSFKTKYIVFLGVSVGMVALTRATEIISVLIPFFYGVTNKKSFIAKVQTLKSYKIQLLIFCFLIVSIGFIQFGYWKSVSGHFFINPYSAGNPGEGLDLHNPHIIKVLFSFRKGWFIYTPIMIFVVFGFWHLFKNNRFLFTPVFIYFIFNLYIVSSWSCWWYGACFGVRALVPSYSLLCLPLGYFIAYVINNKYKVVYLSFCLSFLCLNLFQSWQIYVGIMDSTNMSRAYYFSTFLQTTYPTNEQKKLLLKGKFSSGIDIFTQEDSLTHKLCKIKFNGLNKNDSSIEDKFWIDSIKNSGDYSLLTNSNNTITPPIELKYKEITTKSYSWIKSIAHVYSNHSINNLDASLIIELKHNGYIFRTLKQKLDTSNFKPKKWNKIVLFLLTPDDLRSKKDIVRTYFKNTGKNDILVDDIIIEAYEPIIDKSVF